MLPQKTFRAFSSIREINKKITSLIKSGEINEARNLFDKLTNRNTVTWNSMLSGYVKRHEISNARELFDKLPEPDIVSWNILLSGYFSCRGSRYVDEGRLLFEHMHERDVVSWNTVISGYAKCGRMDEALRLFRRMPERNSVSWNVVVTGFLEIGDVKTAVGFFEEMLDRDDASLCALVSGLVRNGKLDDAEDLLVKYGKIDDGRVDLVFAYNTLIAGYGQKGRINDARRLFDQVFYDADDPRESGGSIIRLKRNVISWNTMIMCFVKAGEVVSARELFDKMKERDAFTWNTMISGYVGMLDMEEASKLFSEMPNPDTVTWNSVISGHAHLGNLGLAYDFFKRMPQKNIVSWNSMIAAFEKKHDLEGAVKLFMQMQAEGIRPDRHTCSSLLSVCAESVALQLGMQTHQLVTKIVVPDVPLNNSLITMYARGGLITDAKAVFDEMKFQRDFISWNAMIGGYASHGFASEALNLFESMKFKVRPTYITFISVLNACAHAGLVEKARSYFKSMTSDFGIEPRVEHFASFVDVLGRYGHLDEAMDVIRTMPVEPDAVVWGALLSACRVHNNVEFARIAAEALMRLEPENSGPYVLLYNIYADVGRWDDANSMRVSRKTNNVVKEAGYSRVNSN
ncbi:hypothetical protein Leryth_019195 [Lithospermum erythrorhizon]|nr:hypothetical protein Leryth_019195 [Lithospermum erythrorhizon]